MEAISRWEKKKWSWDFQYSLNIPVASTSSSSALFGLKKLKNDSIKVVGTVFGKWRDHGDGRKWAFCAKGRSLRSIGRMEAPSSAIERENFKLSKNDVVLLIFFKERTWRVIKNGRLFFLRKKDVFPPCCRRENASRAGERVKKYFWQSTVNFSLKNRANYLFF
jgi:hypothetical protein